MSGQLEPQLWVPDTAAAVRFYRRAFGATIVHRAGGRDDPDGVVQLSVGAGHFWVSGTSEEMGRLDARAIGGTTGRTLLIVEDPRAVAAAATAAGANLTSPVGEEHGWLLGRLVDPFGHQWEVGHPLGAWPPGA